MKENRLTGHNVIHLIYPLRRKSKHIPITHNISNNCEWEEILFSKTDSYNSDEQNLAYIYPEVYETNQNISQGNDNYRKWIATEQLYNFFHPSVQRFLFHDDKKLRVYRNKKIRSRIFNGFFYKDGKKEEEPSSVQFEWISSEIFFFSEDTAYLVIRVSLRENIEVLVNHEKEYGHPVQKINTWMKFLNRIRQNYKKYEGQEFLGVIEQGIQDSRIFTPTYFFNYIEEFINNNSLNVIISSLEHQHNTTEIKKYQRIEPNAYVHAFVQADLDEQLSDTELYQILSIDEYEGESGQNNKFVEEFLHSYVYRRWEPKTYYTSIDYGSVTICHSKNTCYRTSEDKKYDFSDLLYQHHTRQYLILIMLQYYYRDQLQELKSLYSGLTEINKEEQAKCVLEKYYNLNQHFFFDRITNEIQGMELWKFYQKIMDTKILYSSVKADMQELNQRLLEKIGENQNNHIQKLTIIAALTGMLGMNLIIPRADNDMFFSALLGWSISNSVLKICAWIFNGFTALLIVYVLFIVFIDFRKFWKLKRKRKNKV